MGRRRAARPWPQTVVDAALQDANAGRDRVGRDAATDARAGRRAPDPRRRGRHGRRVFSSGVACLAQKLMVVVHPVGHTESGDPTWRTSTPTAAGLQRVTQHLRATLTAALWAAFLAAARPVSTSTTSSLQGSAVTRTTSTTSSPSARYIIRWWRHFAAVRTSLSSVPTTIRILRAGSTVSAVCATSCSQLDRP